MTKTSARLIIDRATGKHTIKVHDEDDQECEQKTVDFIRKISNYIPKGSILPNEGPTMDSSLTSDLSVDNSADRELQDA